MFNIPHFLDYFFFLMIALIISHISLQFYLKYVTIKKPVETDKLDDELMYLYCKMIKRRV